MRFGIRVVLHGRLGSNFSTEQAELNSDKEPGQCIVRESWVPPIVLLTYLPS